MLALQCTCTCVPVSSQSQLNPLSIMAVPHNECLSLPATIKVHKILYTSTLCIQYNGHQWMCLYTILYLFVHLDIQPIRHLIILEEERENSVISVHTPIAIQQSGNTNTCTCRSIQVVRNKTTTSQVYTCTCTHTTQSSFTKKAKACTCMELHTNTVP